MSYSLANFALSKSDCYTVAGAVGSIQGRQGPGIQEAASGPIPGQFFDPRKTASQLGLVRSIRGRQGVDIQEAASGPIPGQFYDPHETAKAIGVRGNPDLRDGMLYLVIPGLTLLISNLSSLRGSEPKQS